jgi:hypothetical protein
MESSGIRKPPVARPSSDSSYNLPVRTYPSFFAETDPAKFDWQFLRVSRLVFENHFVIRRLEAIQ